MIIDREKALVMSSKNTQSQLDSEVTGNVSASQKYIFEAKYGIEIYNVKFSLSTVLSLNRVRILFRVLAQ